MCMAGLGMAQNRQRLIGPAAKNYKFWLDDQKPVTSKVVTANKKPLVGPAAKNTLPRSHKKPITYTQVKSVALKPVARGPRAKSNLPLERMTLKKKKMLRKRKGYQGLNYQRES